LTVFPVRFTAIYVRLLTRAALAVVAPLVLTRPLTARAAFETEVLTAVEKQKTLPDVHVTVGWDRVLEQAKITREWVQDNGGVKEALDVKELRFKEVTQRLNLGLRVGLFHDLEFHVMAPIILQDDSNIWFAKGVRGVSTITGSPNADDPSFPQTADGSSCCARYPITDVPSSRSRSGFGDMTFGLAWSPVVDKKDEAYPTMTFRADIIAPTGKVRDPTEQAALPGKSGGSVGYGLTVFDLSVALSKRMRDETPTFDPYMLFGAQIPVATSGQKARGMEPPPNGRFLVGAELIVDEDQQTYQKYAIDLNFGLRYVGIGRTYSELSDYLPGFDQTKVPSETIGYADYNNPANYRTMLDGASCGKIQGVPCGELTRVDEYLMLQSTLAIHVRPAKYAFFRGGVSFGVNTDHFLTTDKVGTDLDPASAAGKRCEGAECVGRVNAKNSQGVDERSKYYDPRFDTPGHRFRIEETTIFTVFVMGGATF
jgi:hypothetical protein